MSGEIHSTVQEVIKQDEKIEELQQNTALAINVSPKPLMCEECNIKVTSLKILQRHMEGRKHKMRLERKGKSFVCDICEIVANSDTQLNIHLNSSKHKQRLMKKECNEFTTLSPDSKSLGIVIFCIACVFLNLFLLFETVL